jgi:hypothetical protein
MRRRGTAVGSWVERLASVTAISVPSSSREPQTLLDTALPSCGAYRRTTSKETMPPARAGASSLFELPTWPHLDAAPRPLVRHAHMVTVGSKTEVPRNSCCRRETPQSAWLSHFARPITLHRAHKHLFACVPSADLRTLRTHVLFITQPRSAAASRQDAAACPLFPVARGRLRRRLGGRPG